MIFDRILDREDLARRLVDLGERGGERRRLAGAGRVSHVATFSWRARPLILHNPRVRQDAEDDFCGKRVAMIWGCTPSSSLGNWFTVYLSKPYRSLFVPRKFAPRRSRQTATLRGMRLCRLFALLLTLQACSSSEQLMGIGPGDSVDSARNADLMAHFAIPSGGTSSSRQAARPMLFPGSAGSLRAARRAGAAPAEPGVSTHGADVEINFEQADISRGGGPKGLLERIVFSALSSSRGWPLLLMIFELSRRVCPVAVTVKAAVATPRRPAWRASSG